MILGVEKARKLVSLQEAQSETHSFRAEEGTMVVRIEPQEWPFIFIKMFPQKFSLSMRNASIYPRLDQHSVCVCECWAGGEILANFSAPWIKFKEYSFPFPLLASILDKDYVILWRESFLPRSIISTHATRREEKCKKVNGSTRRKKRFVGSNKNINFHTSQHPPEKQSLWLHVAKPHKASPHIYGRAHYSRLAVLGCSSFIFNLLSFQLHNLADAPWWIRLIQVDILADSKASARLFLLLLLFTTSAW